jgi:GGDEF domain-containing protein
MRTTKETGITCSTGMAISTPKNGLDADSLVKIADKTMYEAKKEEGFIIKVAK